MGREPGQPMRPVFAQPAGSKVPVDISFLNMDHAYSWVVFRINRHLYTKEAKLSKVKVSNVLTYTTLDITNGTYAGNASTPEPGIAEKVDERFRNWKLIM